jgi:pimeloyl-ACP methyl ester carboxylesterase
VHGTGGAYSRWAPVASALAERYYVYAVERRGRGESGDAEAYAIEREFEDLVAVAGSIGQPVNLLGHSFGGICALETALRVPDLRRLILYEPPVPVEGAPIFPAGIIDRLQQLLDRGDRAGVMTSFMREVVRMPPHELELFRSSPAWPARVAAARTLPRELRAVEGYRFDAARFAQLDVPTLLLLGADSPAFLKTATMALRAALPNSRLQVMPGQQHIAMDTAPDLFVRAVSEFVDETQ